MGTWGAADDPWNGIPTRDAHAELKSRTRLMKFTTTAHDPAGLRS
jgi:hypothetical protein